MMMVVIANTTTASAAAAAAQERRKLFNCGWNFANLNPNGATVISMAVFLLVLIAMAVAVWGAIELWKNFREWYVVYTRTE